MSESGDLMKIVDDWFLGSGCFLLLLFSYELFLKHLKKFLFLQEYKK